MPYPVYANVSDVVNYLGLPNETTLPDDIERKIKRASELVYYITFGNIKPDNINHERATKQATCAQVEYWLQVSEEEAITGKNYNSFSLGDLSMNFDNTGVEQGQAGQISSRARQYLNMEGLLYRGLGW